MEFKNLGEKFHYYRGLNDNRLLPNSYILVMLDGRSFSKMIKNKFKKPFDKDFVNMMNETAKYLVEHIQGAKIAYVQSDEITIFVTDADNEKSDLFFGGRLCKINSICASLATCEFNRQLTLYNIKNKNTVDDIAKCIENTKYCQFDCKAWNVPNMNEVFAAFLYRNLDCIKNSKNQTSQSYLPHDMLVKKTADEGIAMLKEGKGIDWYELPEGMKYGRIICKREMELVWNGMPYTRNKFVVEDGFPLSEEGNKEKFLDLITYGK